MCTYHNREDCKACKMLGIALKYIDEPMKERLAERAFDKAVEHEQAGE